MDFQVYELEQHVSGPDDGRELEVERTIEPRHARLHHGFTTHRPSLLAQTLAN